MSKNNDGRTKLEVVSDSDGVVFAGTVDQFHAATERAKTALTGGLGGLLAPEYRDSITVPLLKLRQALMAVKPHAGGSKDLPTFRTVRLIPGPDRLFVTATDRRTIALADVPVESCTMGVLDPIDLDPEHVVKILAVHKLTGDKDMWPEYTVRISRDEKLHEVTITDTSGMLDGEALTVPTLAPDATYPETEALIGQAVRFAQKAQEGRAGLIHDRGITEQAWVKIAAATKAYSETAWIQPHYGATGGHLILVGKRFAALAHPVTSRDDEELTDLTPANWRTRWASILPHPVTGEKTA